MSNLKPHYCLYCDSYHSNTAQYLHHVRRHRKRIRQHWYTTAESPTGNKSVFECPNCRKIIPSNDTRLVDRLPTSGNRFRFCKDCFVPQGVWNYQSTSGLSVAHRHTNPTGCPCTPTNSDGCKNFRDGCKNSGEAQTYKCRFCAEEYKLGANLMKHIRIHTGEKPYSCQTCGQRFAQSHEWASHAKMHIRNMRIIASNNTGARQILPKPNNALIGERSYSCYTCGERFAERSECASHAKSHRSLKKVTGRGKHIRKGKTHICHFCKKDYKYLGALRRHKCQQTANNVYYCPYCDKRFENSLECAIHIESHGPTSTEHRCSFCKKEFKSQAILKQHKCTYTGQIYGCPHCHRRFAESSECAKHVKGHRSEPGLSYMCQFCPKKYKLEVSLMKHVRVHTGKKTYSCQICGERFAQSREWASHAKGHMGKVRIQPVARNNTGPRPILPKPNS